MSSATGDPETDSAKLDRIITQLATMKNRLNVHDQRIARTEQFQFGEEDDHGSRHTSPRGNPRRRSGTEEDNTNGGHARGRGSGHHDHNGPREPNLNFPHYDGETNPLPWLNKCEGFFCGYRTLQEDWVWLASLHLEGTTAQWYYQLECDLGVISWARFVEFINMRFGPPIRSNALGELKELHRTSTVEEYQR